MQEYLFTDASRTAAFNLEKTAQNKIRFRTGAGELTLWTGMNGHGKKLLGGQVITGMMYQQAEGFASRRWKCSRNHSGADG